MTTKREIPNGWFIGTGPKSRGIISVGFSEELTAQRDGEVGKSLERWSHTMHTPADPSMRTEEHNRILQDAEAYIQEATGFNPNELAAKKGEFFDEYRGHKEAPFEVDLF